MGRLRQRHGCRLRFRGFGIVKCDSHVKMHGVFVPLDWKADEIIGCPMECHGARGKSIGGIQRGGHTSWIRRGQSARFPLHTQANKKPFFIQNARIQAVIFFGINKKPVFSQNARIQAVIFFGTNKKPVFIHAVIFLGINKKPLY
jgi:hypothetical protein